jgi:signal transduction histidine kinase/ActR/RegA family two-component response regulator
MHLLDERVLVLPPTGRDGTVTASLLERAGLRCMNCDSLASLCEELQRGVGVLVLTDLALFDPEMPRLLDLLAEQPAWSDVPVVMLAREREVPPFAVERLGRLTNMTLLERPASTRSMVSAVRAGLNGRQRQYQIREHIRQQAAAEAALREADRRKDEFLATLAHELRNPLAPLRTGLSVLKSRPSDERLAGRVVGVMDRQLVMLVRLIDDLLDVARISSGKIELVREPVDLRQIVEVALEGCAPAIEAAHHTLSVQLPPEPVWVLGDRARLVQVVGNLVNNASKYTPEGGRIEVGVDGESAEARVRVTDSGVGIAPEMLERVFDMFTQVEGSLYRAQGGLGLGLSLVRSLTEMHGGRVEAHSDGPGRGSVFTVHLPRTDVLAVPARASDAPGQSGRDLRRVLVIDDNVDAAEMMVVGLRALGHEVMCEHAAVDGLERARLLRPDVIFCDIGMPGLNGYDVAARVRADPLLHDTRLVALTGWGSAGDKQRAQAAGFDGHLTKPASLEQIQVALQMFGDPGRPRATRAR